MFKEFKEFISRGSVLDLAVGIIIGSAFTTIVKSLVADIIMPPIGLILGNVDFSSLYINISGSDYPSLAAAKDAGAATINYGIFINALINFLIVGFVVFMMVKGFNSMKRQEETVEEAPTTKDCPYCRSLIAIDATRCPYCTTELN